MYLGQDGGWREDGGCYQQTNHSTSQHLQAHPSSLISSVIRLQDGVSQWNAAGAMDLDFTRALNQIAHDILVDNMEERGGLKYHIQTAVSSGIMSA